MSLPPLLRCKMDRVGSFNVLLATVVCSVLFACGIWLMGGSSSHEMAAPVVVNASAKHTATVIFLHGLGDTGHGWSQMFASVKQPHIKYVCPTAKDIPVTLNGGMRMPSWFDLKGLDPNSNEDAAGIESASKLLQSLISEEEKHGIPASRIVVGGFSQGGAVALYSALTNNKNLGGVVALSTWLPLHKTFPGAIKGNTDTPIFQAHGEADPLVQPTFGAMTAQLLAAINKKHIFKTYPGMGHSSCDKEMSEAKKFIDDCLPAI